MDEFFLILDSKPAVARAIEGAGANTPLKAGLLKLAARARTPGTGALTSLILTPAEESAVLATGVNGAKFLVKWGSRFFLLVVVIDLGVGLIEGEGVKRSVSDRLEIIVAHLSKGSSAASKAFGVGEQLFFILSDALFPEETTVAEFVTETGNTAFLGVRVALRRFQPRPTQSNVGVLSALANVAIANVEPEPGPGQGQPTNQSGHVLFGTVDP